MVQHLRRRNRDWIMDTLSAFSMGRANRGRPLMVFDWEKAARLIKESGAQSAEAGLTGDWGYTGGPILDGGKPVPREDTGAYLASTWATPCVFIDGDYHECFRMQSDTPGWDRDTYWPAGALAILEADA